MNEAVERALAEVQEWEDYGSISPGITETLRSHFAFLDQKIEELHSQLRDALRETNKVDMMVEQARKVMIDAGLKPAKRKKLRRQIEQRLGGERLAELRASARERNKDLRLERGPGPEDDDEDAQLISRSVFECTAWRVDE